MAQGSRNEGGIKVVPADTGWSLTITAASVIFGKNTFSCHLRVEWAGCQDDGHQRAEIPVSCQEESVLL